MRHLDYPCQLCREREGSWKKGQPLGAYFMCRKCQAIYTTKEAQDAQFDKIIAKYKGSKE